MYIYVNAMHELSDNRLYSMLSGGTHKLIVLGYAILSHGKFAEEERIINI